MKKELSKIDNFYRDPREGYRNYFFSLTPSEMSSVLMEMGMSKDNPTITSVLRGKPDEVSASISWVFDTADWGLFRRRILNHVTVREVGRNVGACDVSIIDSAYGYEVRIDIPIGDDGPTIPGGLFVDCWNGESEERVTNEDTEEDMVNSPKHYKHGGIETIDLIEMYLSPEEFIGYLKGTVLKYRERAPYKGNVGMDYDKAYKFWTWLLEKKTTESTKDRYLAVKSTINSVYSSETFEKNPRKPELTIDGYYKCPVCGKSLTKNVKVPSGEIYVDHFNYCSGCGIAINWDEVL